MIVKTTYQFAAQEQQQFLNVCKRQGFEIKTDFLPSGHESFKVYLPDREVLVGFFSPISTHTTASGGWLDVVKLEIAA